MRWIILAAALIVSACSAAGEAARPTAAPTAPPTPTPSVPSPTSPVASRTPLPRLDPAPAPIVRLATAPLGALRGARIYAIKEFAAPNGTGVVRELWSATLEGPSVSALAARIEFPSEGTIPERPIPGMTLRNLFSSDGRRILVDDGDYTLTTIDLATGRASSLGITGYAPTWTRDGRWIVYTSRAPNADDLNAYTLWAIPADGQSTAPRRIPGAAVSAVAGDSRIVVFDPNERRQVVVDVADGRRLGPLPGQVGRVVWRSNAPQFGLVRDEQQTPGAGRPDDATSVVVAADDLSGARVVATRSGSQYEVRFQELRWNPVRDELLYTIEGRGRSFGIVDTVTGAERALPGPAQYVTWAQDGEQLVGLLRSDAGPPPRPSELPQSIAYNRSTVVVLARDGLVTRTTSISALEPYEFMQQVVTVGY